MIPGRLRSAVEAWIAEDPEPRHAATLRQFLDAGDLDALGEAFGAPLSFGTAGLRGPLGPGPARMNRAVVRRTALALCRWLDDEEVDGPVVIGRDARHGSVAFAEDTAAVVARTGRRAVLSDGPIPTPLLAYSVRALGAAAGVMVTASHNPPADNGYKVYARDGAQIVSPMDREIASRLPSPGQLPAVSGSDRSSPLVSTLPADVVDRYLDEVAAVRRVTAVPTVTVAYTPLHGVGATLLDRAFLRSGLAPPRVVAAQADPDPDFPTVAFPNPEEPGAMDLVIELGASIDADVVLANDPDADRLGAAVPDGGGWRILTGDEIGTLLADHLLRHTTGSDRLVASSLVSSTMLASLAAAHGVAHATTLTGFKWLARAGDDRPDLRLLLAYEEALGFAVSSEVRDKDGISAAVLFVEMAASLVGDGRTVPGRLAELAVAHGLHRTRQSSRFLPPADRATVLAALSAEPPASLGGIEIVEVTDLAVGGPLPPTDGMILRGHGLRVIVRPSGTEPKLKRYVELVRPVGAVDAVPAVTAAADAVIDAVLADLDR